MGKGRLWILCMLVVGLLVGLLLQWLVFATRTLFCSPFVVPAALLPLPTCCLTNFLSLSNSSIDSHPSG